MKYYFLIKHMIRFEYLLELSIVDGTNYLVCTHSTCHESNKNTDDATTFYFILISKFAKSIEASRRSFAGELESSPIK